MLISMQTTDDWPTNLWLTINVFLPDYSKETRRLLACLKKWICCWWLSDIKACANFWNHSSAFVDRWNMKIVLVRAKPFCTKNWVLCVHFVCVQVLALLFAVVCSQPPNNGYLPPGRTYFYAPPPVQAIDFGPGLVAAPTPAPETGGFVWSRGCAHCDNPTI